jgi:DNA polymerase III subunit epsilon
MREIVFDTETTGLDPLQERVIEIGAVELENRFPTGRFFHHYLQPEGRRINPEATNVHGITDAMLAGKPLFRDVVDDFIAFVGDGVLVAHNASFDRSFLNAEFGRLERQAFPEDRYVDTLALAKRRHPLGPNSLDALCRRYGIDNSRRTKHGALLDAELLAEVYLEMAGGRQAALGLVLDAAPGADANRQRLDADAPARLPVRPAPLAPRISEAEKAAHAAMVESLGQSALWPRIA